MAGLPHGPRSVSSDAPPASPRLRLTLDLEPQGDPVAGVLRGASGVEEPFFGWSGLARAIELALEAQRPGRSADGAGGGAK